MRELRIFATALLLAPTLFLSACATRTPAPVVERPQADAVKPAAAAVPAAPGDKRPDTPPQIHVVAKGETLIAVALQYGLDYKDLAAWNQIENVNLIQVGQELRVTPPLVPGVVATPLATPGSPVATPITSAPPIVGTPSPAVAATVPPGPDGKATTTTLKTEPKAVKVPYSDKALAELEADARNQGTLESSAPPAAPVSGTPPVAVPPKPDDDKLDWGWPAKGKLLAGYSESSKGIDIGGARGTPVLAAGNGKVMYSGTGIRGYGKLVIIKHNNMYLSAYAHNDNVLVKEGQEVKKGQRIADMGSTDADQVKLHFEIRRQGKPVDPAKLLPAS